MTTPRASRPAMALIAAILALLVATSAARAEGEAGLVVDFGNGEVITYCVAFEGNDISGAQMMAQVGLNVNQFSGLVCAIDGTGCQHSGSFDSCTCECKPGSGSCTYWSFFNQRYGGSWVYSASGLQTARSKDGDLQAWKWGPGGANSAPAPGAISFEQVCGHAPRGGGSEPPTATQPPPTPAPTSPPATNAPATSAPATTAAGTTPLVTITAAASAAASPSAGASSTAPGTASPAGSPTATGTSDPATAAATGSAEASAAPGRTTISPSVAPRQTVTPTGDGDGGSSAPNLIAFGVIAGLLVAAIGIAVIRGQRS